jgi:hypothetical protein
LVAHYLNPYGCEFYNPSGMISVTFNQTSVSWQQRRIAGIVNTARHIDGGAVIV